MVNNKKDKVSSKIKLIPIIIGCILIVAILAFAYLKTRETESTPTQEVEEECKINTNLYNNRKIFTVTPPNGATSNKKIIFFHGGSYMAEMTSEHWDFIKKIVKDTGMTVIIPDYPLAPKYTYKDVFEMVEPLYKDIIEKVASENLIFMGDSAGGGLALALLEKLEQDNESIATPSKTILISPWLDASMENEKIEEVQKKDKKLNAQTLKLAGIAYAGDLDLKNYLISPMYGDISKLKNITILTGTDDILNPDVYVLKDKMNQIGKDIDVHTFENASHDWIIEDGDENQLVKQGYQELIYLLKNS